MSPRTCALIGLALLACAQSLAYFGLRPQRAAQARPGEVYGALPPGEFAGTMLLGGFRGLATDLMWMRAVNAKDEGRFYESMALARAISQVQPRFELVWEFMAWDMGYNIGHEVEDRDGKWGWYLAGLAANAEGCERNPRSERLLRHLAWMFFHKGDTFADRVAAARWDAMLNPVIAGVNRQLPAASRIDALPAAAGLSNFRIAARLYQGAVALADDGGLAIPPYIRRQVPLAIERDGNLLRNRGEHRLALVRWLDALAAWQVVKAWNERPVVDGDDAFQKQVGRETWEINDGRLRRKAAYLAEQLAGDRASGQRTATAINERRWDEARALLATGDWRASVPRAQVVWLGETTGKDEALRP